MTVMDDQKDTEAVPLVHAEPASSTVEKGESGMVEVTAPMDLPEGYQLTVNVNNSQRSVTVPPGGVRSGETFKASASGSAEVYSNIPTGDWRDGLCDCFRFGCCHAMCWLGWCCQPVLSGQVMTRMSRDWFGGPGDRPIKSKTCSIVVTIWIIVVVIDIVLGSIQRSTYCFGGRTMINFDTGVQYIECPDGSIEYPTQTFMVLGQVSYWIGFVFFLYMLIAVCRTRANMRRKYQCDNEENFQN